MTAVPGARCLNTMLIAIRVHACPKYTLILFFCKLTQVVDNFFPKMRGFLLAYLAYLPLEVCKQNFR